MLTGINEIMFTLSLSIIIYCYILYPLAVKLIGRVHRSAIQRRDITPLVSIIIAAHNEANVIKKNLENKLTLNYPSNRMEIIVVSDGSDDGTDDIVRAFGELNVKLLRQEPRQGKTAGLNRAVSQAGGEIIFFADANSIWDEDAIMRIVRNFADPNVGYVTGKMVYVNESGSIIGDGCSAYMKYENMLRTWETQIGSVVGVDGGIDAVRKSLYEAMRPDLLPDFVLPLRVVAKGYRVIYEPEAILKEESLAGTKDEFRMRVRVILRSLHALRQMKHLFNPLRYPFFSWQLVSHKVLRYLVWLFMLVLLVINFFLTDRGPVYTFMLWSQLIFYLLVLIGFVSEKMNIAARKVTYIPYYFFIVNLSSAVAFVRFLRRQNIVMWQPRKG